MVMNRIWHTVGRRRGRIQDRKRRETVSRIINSGQRVLGTVMFNPNPWADAIKHQPEVHLINVTRDNHQKVLEELRQWLNIKG